MHEYCITNRKHYYSRINRTEGFPSGWLQWEYTPRSLGHFTLQPTVVIQFERHYKDIIVKL